MESWFAATAVDPAAAAETFCSEPTLELVFGEAAQEGDWNDADQVRDGDQAWFRAGQAGGWFLFVGIETTSLSQELTIQLADSYAVQEETGTIEGFGAEQRRRAMREEPDSSLQRDWGLRAVLPCELAPVEPLDEAACEWLGVPDEAVSLELTVTVTDLAGRSATVTHHGHIQVEEHPPCKRGVDPR